MSIKANNRHGCFGDFSTGESNAKAKVTHLAVRSFVLSLFSGAPLLYVIRRNGVKTADGLCSKQVYIYGCVDATINITGKCKMVAIDGCKKTKVSQASKVCQRWYMLAFSVHRPLIS